MMLCIPDHNGHQYLIDFDFNLEGGNLRVVGLLRCQAGAHYEGQPAQDNKQNRLPVHSHTDTNDPTSAVPWQQYQANQRAIADFTGESRVGDG
jgi:hypothetical protein